MIKVLFVCHGNICRSPMAEFMFKDMVSSEGLEDEFYIASAAVSSEESENAVYPPAKKKLEEEGIGCSGKKAVKMRRSDYDKYDYIIAMEQYNIEKYTFYWTLPKEKAILPTPGIQETLTKPMTTLRRALKDF